MQAQYIGTGRSIYIVTDGGDDPVVITSNTKDLKYMGCEIILVITTHTSEWSYILTYNISIEYNMTLEISGLILRINATKEDQVSGQSTIKSM